MRLDKLIFLQKTKIILFGILLISAILRIWNLDSVPPSASLDEASIGYNAYSVLRTGVDEFRQFPLISQRGYDDYRRSTYLFLTIPFIYVLDLNVVAVRLPAVILSILTVLAFYGIAKEVIKEKKYSEFFALISSFFLAISSWHIYISRMGHESNACLSFLVFAIFFFLKGLKKDYFLVFSFLFFLLSMISYYSGQIVVPLIVVVLFALYYKHILKVIIRNRFNLFLSAIFFGLTALVLWSIFSPSALIRYRGTSTLSPQAHQEEFDLRVQLRNTAVAKHDLIGTVFYNRHFFTLQVLLEGYFSHFNYEWLFFNPSNGAFKAPQSGLLNIWEAPFIIIGIVGLLLTKIVDTRKKIFLFSWLLIGPLPASIATQAPHAMRSYNMLPAIELLGAFGFIFLIVRFNKIKLFLTGILLVISALGVTKFSYDYFVLFPKIQSKAYQYAFSKTIPYITRNQDKYKKIIFSNEDNLYQSYMIFLYYAKYDPKKYQLQGGTKSGGYKETHYFWRYEFRPISWKLEDKRDTLFIGNPEDFPQDVKNVFEGRYLDNSIGTRIVISN